MSNLAVEDILSGMTDAEVLLLALESHPERLHEIKISRDQRAWLLANGDKERILPKIPVHILERAARRGAVASPMGLDEQVRKDLAKQRGRVELAIQAIRRTGELLRGPETAGENPRMQVAYVLTTTPEKGGTWRADIVPRARTFTKTQGWKLDNPDLRRTQTLILNLPHTVPKYMSPADIPLIAACGEPPGYGWGARPASPMPFHPLLELVAGTGRLFLPDHTPLSLDENLWRLAPSLDVDDDMGRFSFSLEPMEGAAARIPLETGWKAVGEEGNWTVLTGSVLHRLDPRTPRALFALSVDMPPLPAQELSRVRSDLSLLSRHGVAVPTQYLPPRLCEAPRRCACVEVAGEAASIVVEIAYPSLEVPEEETSRILAFTQEDGTLAELERDLEAESALHRELEAILREAEVEIVPEGGGWTVSDPQSLQRLAVHGLGRLESAGWEVRQASRLDRWKRRKGVFKAVAKASGQDWFELSGVVDFDGIEIPLSTLIARRWSPNLPDGSTGELSEALLKRLRWMQSLGKTTEDGIRLNGFHAALAKELLEGGHAQAQDPALWKRQLAKATGADTTEVPLPRSLQATLRPYQKAGLDWLSSLRRRGIGGILADDMGLGKTVQLIAHLCRVFETEPKAPAALVVGPASVVGNWIQEIERFAPHLRTRLLHGTDRESLRDAPVDEPTVYVTTYGIVPREIEWLRSREFSLVVLDESQSIRNPDTITHQSCLEISAKQKVCLTGTPIENSLSDLWAQFSFLNPGLLGPRQEFLSQFEPALAEKPDLSRLRLVTAPFWLRRTKTSVALELPPREDIVLSVELDPKQSALYQRQLKEYQKNLLPQLRRKGLDDGGRFQVLTALLRLRQIACAPELAGHKGPAAKLDLLLDKLEEDIAEGHRVLVFSSFTSLLDLVGKRLRDKSLDYLRLDGSTPAAERTRLIRRFQTGEHEPIFLVSLKAGGAGINLTAADNVFLLDPWWNPAAEEQAAARAHRIGQSRPVTLYRMVAKGTIEERVLALSRSKAALASELFDAGESGGTTLTMEVVQELLG